MRLTSRFALAALFAFSLINFVGCGDDKGTGPDNSSDPIVAPKQGSTYNYATYDTDASGQKVSGSDETYSTTVASSSMSFMGKSNVYMFVQTGDQTDTSYIAYESNGDVSIFLGSQLSQLDMEGVNFGSNLWLTIPFASKSTKSVTVVDTTITDGPFGSQKIKLVISGTGTNSEEITVGTEKFNARKADMKMEMEMTISSIPTTSTSTTTMWFIPKLGTMGKTSTKTVAALGGVPTQTSGSVEALTSYTLK